MAGPRYWRSSATPQCEAPANGYSSATNEANVSTAMTKFDPVIFRELPVIHQIILNETWLEAERRGCCVRSDDQAVRENVCLVVLRIGAQLRKSTERALAGSSLQIQYPIWPDAA